MTPLTAGKQNKVISFVEAQGWKYRQSGDELELGCPIAECPNFGEPQFYINVKTQKYHCKRCGASGHTLKKLEYSLGLVKTKEPVKSGCFISERDIESWQRALQEDAEAYNYLTQKRGLKDSTIAQFKLGFIEKEKFADYEGPAIFWPDYKNGVCTGGEYHFFERADGEPNKKIRYGSQLHFLNIDRLTPKQPLLITEGRYDMATAWQYGYQNVTSVPNGASSLEDAWFGDIQYFPKYYISTDNDQAGYQCAEKLAKKLGTTKCYRVYLKLKDISDYAQYGLEKADLDEAVQMAEPMFIPPVVEIGHYLDAAQAAIACPDVAGGFALEWKQVNDIIKGVRLGELTTSSGKTGSGKTTFALAIVGHLARNGVKCLIASPEMEEKDLLIELACNHFKKRVNKDELRQYTEMFQDRIYIDKVFDSWTLGSHESLADKVFDTIQYAVENKGVQFVVLDHMRLFLSSKKKDETMWAIDDLLRRCVHCVITNKIHIWLIAQPRKPHENMFPCKKCRKPIWNKMTMDDLKGSSNIEQDSANIILVHRYLKKYCSCSYKMDERIVEIEVAKNRKFGTCDTAVLSFDLLSKSNYVEAVL